MTIIVKALAERKLIYQTAVSTQGKKAAAEPTINWFRRMYYAEHSPIRSRIFSIEMEIPSWVSTHFVRHKIGVEHYVQSSREDLTGKERDAQAIVKHIMIANAQAIINISRKRLCRCAHVRTRAEWKDVLDFLRGIDPELVDVCVPECIYRGFCPEMRPCGYQETVNAAIARTEYVNKLRNEEK